MDETQNNMEKIFATPKLFSVSRTVAKLQVEPIPSAERIRGHYFVSGFTGQRIVKLPAGVIQNAVRQPLTRPLLASSAGFYPKAAGHLARRPVGISQTIFIYCTVGYGWCEMLGRRHEVRPGHLLVLPANTAHSYGAAGKNPWSIRWFHAVGDQLVPFLEALGTTGQYPTVFLGDDPLLSALFEEVLAELESGYTSLNLIYASQTAAHLLGAMIRRRHNTWVGAPDPHQKIARCIELMRTHLDRPLRMAQLAAICNFSTPHFTKLFKVQTGYTPKDYFTRLKMHQASQLLNNTGLSIKEIAQQVGYDDPLHFSRVFKQINAQSPTDHRKKHLE